MYVFHGTRKELRDVIEKLAKGLAGVEDRYGVGAAFRTVLGFTLLSNIYDAFVTKSRGGTDEMGIRWPPLSPKTIAQRRVGPRDTDEARRRKKIYDREYRKLYQKYLLSMTDSEAKAAANRRANFLATKETGKTKVETLGYRQVEMLRDTGMLANSLLPGSLLGSGLQAKYREPASGEDQVFQVEGGEIVIGTDREYAWAHQWGTKRIPRRQFLPDDETPIPHVWIEDLEDVAENFMYDAVEHIMTASGGRPS